MPSPRLETVILSLAHTAPALLGIDWLDPETLLKAGGWAALVLACAFARCDLYVRELIRLLKRLRTELADPETYVAALATFTLGRTFLEANSLCDIARATVGLGTLQEGAAFNRQADASLLTDTLGRLGGITAPTLVISTLDDRFFADPFAQEMAAAIPGAVKRDMPGIGHCPMIEAPSAFAALVRDFLAA